MSRLLRWLRQHAGLQDLRVWVRAHLLWVLGVGAVLAILGYWQFAPAPPVAARPEQKAPQSSLGLTKDDTGLKLLDKQKENKELLEKLAQATQAAEASKELFAQAEKDRKQETAGLQKAVQDLSRRLDTPPKREAPAPKLLERPVGPRAVVATTPAASPAGRPQTKLHIFSRPKDPQAEEPPPSYDPDAAFLPPACIADARAVTGVLATSAPSGALPMLLLLTGEFHCPYLLPGLEQRPRPTAVPLQGCAVFGTAVGDMASSRARLTVDQLICVFADRKAFVREIKGYVTDVDNTLGLFAEVQHHTSAAMTKATLTALIQEASAAFGYAKSTFLVTGTGGAGPQVGSGVQNGLQQITQFYIQQASKLLPTLWVKANTPARVVLQKGIVLDGFPTTINVSARGES